MADAQDLVRDLAVAVLDSFEKLELVLHLEQAPAPVPIDAIAAAVRIDRATMNECLAALAREQVIASAGGGYEIVRGGTWSSHVRELSKLYQADRILVMTIMSEAALKRLRMQANRAFADAFVIRGKKRGDD